MRPPEPGETPLSHAERWIAIREGIHAATWHPALTRNWSVMSAKLHRAAAISAMEAKGTTS